jgi:hypothetical protein
VTTENLCPKDSVKQLFSSLQRKQARLLGDPCKLELVENVMMEVGVLFQGAVLRNLAEIGHHISKKVEFQEKAASILHTNWCALETLLTATGSAIWIGMKTCRKHSERKL